MVTDEKIQYIIDDIELLYAEYDSACEHLGACEAHGRALTDEEMDGLGEGGPYIESHISADYFRELESKLKTASNNTVLDKMGDEEEEKLNQAIKEINDKINAY